MAQWKTVGNNLARELAGIPPDQRLAVFQQRLAELPIAYRAKVEHYAYLGMLIVEGDLKTEVILSKHKTISGIAKLSFVLAAILAIAGIVLVYISNDDAMTKINILGSSIETGSVGVACVGMAGLMFLFIVRSAFSKL